MERKIFFTLVQAGIQSLRIETEKCKQIFASAEINWDSIYRISVDQGVTAIVWDGIQSLADKKIIPDTKMPNKLQNLNWICNIDRIEKIYEKQVNTTYKLAIFYHKYDIKMMLLKGYGLSLLYPIPSHRPCGDIDIWLYGKQKIADKLINQKKGINVNEDKHQHTIFYIDGIMVENHYEFMHIHGHHSNIIIENLLQKYAYEESEEIDINGVSVSLPSVNFNTLFLLRHMASHFAAERICLRHIIDWYFFVHKYHNVIDWQHLEKLANELNMDKFLHCINAISIDYLGLNPDFIPRFIRDYTLETRVLEDILSPEFSLPRPKNSKIKTLFYKFQRWWANRWKHKIVYSEGLLKTLFVQLYSHILKPKSLFH